MPSREKIRGDYEGRIKLDCERGEFCSRVGFNCGMQAEGPPGWDGPQEAL